MLWPPEIVRQPSTMISLEWFQLVAQVCMTATCRLMFGEGARSRMNWSISGIGSTWAGGIGK